MGDLVEQRGLPLGGEAAVEEQRGLDGADGRVDGEPQLAVGEVAAQRREQVHPVLDVVPLPPPQPTPVFLGQRVDLPVVDGEHDRSSIATAMWSLTSADRAAWPSGTEARMAAAPSASRSIPRSSSATSRASLLAKCR